MMAALSTAASCCDSAAGRTISYPLSAAQFLSIAFSKHPLGPGLCPAVEPRDGPVWLYTFVEDTVTSGCLALGFPRRFSCSSMCVLAVVGGGERQVHVTFLASLGKTVKVQLFHNPLPDLRNLSLVGQGYDSAAYQAPLGSSDACQS